MRTDDLIGQLSANLEPVKRGAIGRLLLGTILIGMIGSAMVMLGMLGLRHDFSGAMMSFGMWTKLAYTFAVAVFAFFLLERVGRPGADMYKPALLMALPLLYIVLLAIIQLSAPGADKHGLMMGHSSQVCAPLVLLTALPTLAATFWVLRRLAPTRLTMAGAIAGLFAGGAGAFVYSFHCTEGAAPFIAIWYTLGIMLTTALGALLGRHFLRW